MKYRKYPRCKTCKSDFFKNFDGVCISCKTQEIDYEAGFSIPGTSIDDQVRYADMDRMASLEGGY